MSKFQKVTLSQVSDNFDKIRVPLSSRERENIAKIYPYYGAQGIIDYVDNFLYDGEYILIAEDGENLKSQKNPICNLVKGKFWVNNHAHIIRAKDGHNNKYLCYLLNLVNFRPYVSGSAQPKLTQDNLNNIELNILNKETQQKIAKVLSDLDTKIELNNRINSELEAMAKTLHDYWFVQFDFPDTNGKPYKSTGGKMVWNEELKREIPEVWEIGTLDDLGKIIGGSTPSKAVEDNFCSEGIPWITPKDLSLNSGKKFISKGELDVSEKGFKSASLKTLPKNSILLSSRAPIGYMVIARNDVTTNQGFKSFVPSKGYSTPFIFYTIKNSMKVIEANASGSTFKEISGGVLKSISVCLSNKNIIDLFSKKVESIFKQQDVLEQENQELASLRDWLLPMLMNGQVRVGDVEEQLGMVAERSAEYKKDIH